MPSDSLNLSIRLFCEMNTDTYPNIYDFPKCCNVAICGDIHGDFNLLVNKVEQEEAVNCFRSLYLWVDLQPEVFYIQLVMRNTNSNNAAAAAESHKIGADSFIIETRIELFQIADRFSEWEKQMYEKKKLLMDGRLDNEIRTMNTAFYQLDEALRRIMNEELEFDILRHGTVTE